MRKEGKEEGEERVRGSGKGEGRERVWKGENIFFFLIEFHIYLYLESSSTQIYCLIFFTGEGKSKTK